MLFICLFLVVLGLRCCAQAFCSCGEWASHCNGFSCCGAQALGTKASVFAAHGFLGHGLQSAGLVVVAMGLPRCIWDLPGPGIELMSPALAGGFFTNEPSGKSIFKVVVNYFS